MCFRDPSRSRGCVPSVRSLDRIGEFFFSFICSEQHTKCEHNRLEHNTVIQLGKWTQHTYKHSLIQLHRFTALPKVCAPLSVPPVSASLLRLHHNELHSSGEASRATRERFDFGHHDKAKARYEHELADVCAFVVKRSATLALPEHTSVPMKAMLLWDVRSLLTC